MSWSLKRRIESATWAEFAVWFGVYVVFNWWAFYTSSPWTRALEAGGGKLPESQFDFPQGEPQRSLDALGSATGDYLLWQALDIPYAALNLLVSSLAIALALKATRLGGSAARFILLLPPIYVAAEVVENTLVAAFAARLVEPGGIAVPVQQTATAIKAYSGFGSMALALVCLAIAALAPAAGLFRKRA